MGLSYTSLKKKYLTGLDYNDPVQVKKVLGIVVKAYLVRFISSDDLSDLANTIWQPGIFTTKETELLDTHLLYAAELSYYERQSFLTNKSRDIFIQSLKKLMVFTKVQ